MTAPSPAPQRRRSWPRWARRGRLEFIATLLIAAGVVMLLQPFTLIMPESWVKAAMPVLMELFRYAVLVTLTGTVMFIIVSKFPD